MLAGKFVKLHVENSGCVWEMEFERGKDSNHNKPSRLKKTHNHSKILTLKTVISHELQKHRKQTTHFYR